MSSQRWKRNAWIVHLRTKGESPAQIGRQFRITACRVRQIVKKSDPIQARQAELANVYGDIPDFRSLPDDAPVDVLMLCAGKVHGWSTRIRGLATGSLGLKTIGDLRQISDAELLRAPGIGERMVTQLRLFCPGRPGRG